MRIEVKGRGLQVTDELRECVARHFEKVSKQVSEVAVLEVELSDGAPKPDTCAVEAALRLKGVTLRAEDRSRGIEHAIHLVADDMARQVKRNRDKRRNRREARGLAPEPADAGGDSLPAL